MTQREPNDHSHFQTPEPHSRESLRAKSATEHKLQSALFPRYKDGQPVEIESISSDGGNRIRSAKSAFQSPPATPGDTDGRRTHSPLLSCVAAVDKSSEAF